MRPQSCRRHAEPVPQHQPDMLASPNDDIFRQQQAINQEAAMMPTSTLPARSSARPVHPATPMPIAGDALDPARMDLAALLRRSLAESERFYRGHQHDTRFAYELFRRALVEHNEIAWEHIYVHDSPLVESWIRRSGAF